MNPTAAPLPGPRAARTGEPMDETTPPAREAGAVLPSSGDLPDSCDQQAQTEDVSDDEDDEYEPL